MKKHKEYFAERRKYLRLETVFPVEFQLYSKNKKETVSALLQGFTRDVSEGGMCLEVNELENGFVHQLELEDTELKLYINMPHHKEPIEANAGLRWSKKIKEGFPNKYVIGLEYIHIPNNVRKSIIGYARKRRMRPRLIAASVLCLVTLCGLLVWQVYDIGLKKEITERELIKLEKKLTEARDKELVFESKIHALNMKGQLLGGDVLNSKNKIDSLEEKIAKLTVRNGSLDSQLASEKLSLEKELAHWHKERDILAKELEQLKFSREKLNKELLKLRQFDDSRVVRVKLTNGNWITGQLIDVSSDKINIKVGLGSVGIEKSMIESMEEVSGTAKINIQKEWVRQEEEAQKLNNKWKEMVALKHAQGLVYFNGKWIKKEEAQAIQSDLKKKEEQVFRLIAEKQLASITKEKDKNYLKSLIQENKKPIISLKDRRIYLNGRLFFIKGVGYGMEYPKTPGGMATYKSMPRSVFEKDFQLMKEAGINAIRTYEPLPVKLLNLAEKYGIMVIENICYPSDYTDFDSRIHLDILKEQIRKYVARDKNRKCILMWSIWNDAPWAWGSRGNVVERYDYTKINSFLKELYDTVKQYDIAHPVTAGNAIGLRGESLGWDFLDVIGLNLYLGGYDWFAQQNAKRQVAIIKGIEEKYNKPVVILETGCSTFIKGQSQEEVLEKQIKAAGTKVAGITIFQWADGWQKAGDYNTQDDHIEEHWGILDGYRNPKPGYKAVTRMFNIIPTESYGYTDKEVRLNTK